MELRARRAEAEHSNPEACGPTGRRRPTRVDAAAPVESRISSARSVYFRFATGIRPAETGSLTTRKRWAASGPRGRAQRASAGRSALLERRVRAAGPSAAPRRRSRCRRRRWAGGRAARCPRRSAAPRSANRPAEYGSSGSATSSMWYRTSERCAGGRLGRSDVEPAVDREGVRRDDLPGPREGHGVGQLRLAGARGPDDHEELRPRGSLAAHGRSRPRQASRVAAGQELDAAVGPLVRAEHRDAAAAERVERRGRGMAEPVAPPAREQRELRRDRVDEGRGSSTCGFRGARPSGRRRAAAAPALAQGVLRRRPDVSGQERGAPVALDESDDGLVVDAVDLAHRAAGVQDRSAHAVGLERVAGAKNARTGTPRRSASAVRPCVESALVRTVGAPELCRPGSSSRTAKRPSA